ncbi:hypothetical protein G7046_g7564 [Stylonectria norvegica]|nr:hypothetical protein G7046_g7564 [Stylonectria norvegica]
MASLPKEMKALSHTLIRVSPLWSATPLDSQLPQTCGHPTILYADLPHHASRYEKPEDWSIVTVPLPKLRDNDVLVKVKACGVCGTDLHIHEGEFIAKFPLIPGHETVGVIAAVGKDVKEFKIGDRVAADNSELCGECFYCRRGQLLLCENFNAHGVTMDGGFAEYCAYPAGKVFTIKNLSWVDATLLEPASCACHGLDKIRPKLGSHVLMFGAGPTGLMLAQLLRQNGGCQVTIAAPKGLKMDLAKSLDAADTYVELSRSEPEAQFTKLKADNPYGFDVVVEATGSVKILEDAIHYVRRGGTLVVYGVYSSKDRVSWPPSKIFGDEITILGSFSETYMFPATIDYLDSGKVKTKGIVNKTFKLEQFGEALQSIKDKSAIKAAIVFDDDIAEPERDSLAQASVNVISTELAIFTYAQIIDGLPTANVVYDRRIPGVPGDHIIEDVHEQLCSGAVEKAREFQEAWDASVLMFDLKAVNDYQAAPPGSKAANLRLIELVAVALHQIGVLLFQLDLRMLRGDIDGVLNWARPGDKPPPSLFAHGGHIDDDVYPEGVADMVGYWADPRILGGVALFDRSKVAVDDLPNVYFHSIVRG